MSIVTYCLHKVNIILYIDIKVGIWDTIGVGGNMKDFNNIDDAVLIHMWRVAFDKLAEAQSDKDNLKRLKRCEYRLFLIVRELDRRGI